MVVGGLPASRVTQDCDVLAMEPDEQWDVLVQAAQATARSHKLPATWFNRDSRMFVHRLPLGWRKRCESIDHYGPLHVLVISRRDLMAMKLISAITRPQDLQDLQSMNPTPPEIQFMAQHLDRLESESLDRENFDAQRTILKRLGSDHEKHGS